MNEREAIRQYVMRLVGGRPVRWADERTTLGDFAGRDWTLEIFGVTREERSKLQDGLWELQKRVWEHTGHSLLLIFLTPDSTERHYSWVHKRELAEGNTAARTVTRRHPLLLTQPQHSDLPVVPVPRAG